MQQVWQAKHFAKMCFTGQTTTHARQDGPRQRSPNCSAQVNTVVVSITLAQDEQDSSWDDEYIYTLGHEPEKMQVPQINGNNGVEMKNAD